MPEPISPARIKICGLTQLQDAQLAAQLGAFALGFVFYTKSPRAINAQAAAEIISALSDTHTPQGDKLWKVGVFVNADYDELAQTAETVGLTHLQLHGNESPALCQCLQKSGFKVIKALRLNSPDELEQLTDYPSPILIDAAVPGVWGGSGHLADWELATLAAQRQRVILAGGLKPENISAAISTVRPWAFDLSSGVESSPGIKNHDLLKQLFERVNDSVNDPVNERVKERDIYANPD